MTELISIQSELKAPKSQTNSFGKYKYRSAEDILEAVKPLLKKYECCLTLSDDIIEIGGRHYVASCATISKSNIDISIKAVGWAREAESKKGCDASQLTGLTSSYARKSALNGLFAIDDTKDSDALPPEQESKKTAMEYTLMINATKTLSELQELWGSIPKDIRTELELQKNAQKLVLS